MKETIKPQLEGWIKIGDISAVICHVYNDNRVDAVYLNRKQEAMKDAFHMVEGNWEFINPGADGSYAKNSPDLAKFIAQLKSGLSRLNNPYI